MEKSRAPPKRKRGKRVDEKTIQRIKKLQALAERGVGGEKTTAAAMLEKLLAKNGIETLEELETEEAEYFLFSYKGKHEITLLKQCMYKVIGAAAGREYYRSHGTRQKIGIYCTKAQKIEIELEFEFYRNVFYEELDNFMCAFIQAQKIFPTDAPRRDIDITELTPEDLSRMAMQDAIKKRTRAAMIESAGYQPTEK
ncbi:DUF2786 domain-containing protein [Konateibacter massiliensis]|uniref:DUF2786 domain-containing protein n=1 Tax=Konateibacter massiliensis TaxID=2002841 RepID=UPI001F41082E|nr:DUF2786 domain-containing protein [Konateibacter massiliensis]